MIAGSRDERKSALQARARALLVTEIQRPRAPLRSDAEERRRTGRSSCAASRRTTSSSRPRRSATRPRRRSSATSQEEEPARAPASSRRVAQARSKIARCGARKNAIKYYNARSIPNATTRTTATARRGPLLPRVRVRAGERPRRTRARSTSSSSQKTPKSKYIPNAYLAFGELFFNEAQGDPRSGSSREQAYKKVIKYPPPDNKVYGYAQYKLGYVFWNKGDFAQALDAFKKTIDFGDAVRAAARTRRSSPTARAGHRSRSTRSRASRTGLQLLQAALGRRRRRERQDVQDDGRPRPELPRHRSLSRGDRLYKDLMVRDTAATSTACTSRTSPKRRMAMKSGDKDAIVDGARQPVQASTTTFKSENHADDAKQECANTTAALVDRDGDGVAPRGRRLGGAARHRRPEDDGRSRRYLYKKVVDTWNADEFAKFEFPRIVKEDWPTIYKIKYDMADLLYFQQKWAECGPAFDAVVAGEPDRRPRPRRPRTPRCSATRTSTTQHAQGRRRQEGHRQPPGRRSKDASEDATTTTSIKPKDFTDAQKGDDPAPSTGTSATSSPTRATPTAQEQLVEVKYARAPHLLRGAALGGGGGLLPRRRDQPLRQRRRRSTRRSSTSRASTSSAFAREPTAPACFDDMVADVPKFLELYCAGDKMQKNEEHVHASSTKVQCDIQRLKAQKHRRGGRQGRQRARSSSSRRAARRTSTSGRSTARTPLANEPAAAVRAARRDRLQRRAAFQAARLIAKCDPRAHDPAQPDVQAGQDASSRRRRCTRSAATTRRSPSTTRRPTGTSVREGERAPARTPTRRSPTPIVLRLGLGQEDQAIEDVKQFQQELRRDEARRRPRRSRSPSARTTPTRKTGRTRARRSRARWALIDKAPPDIQVQAHATLARALMHLKRRAQAQGRVREGPRALGRRPATPQAKINDAYKGEDEDAASPPRSARRSTRSARRSSSPPRSRSRTRSMRSRSPSTRAPGTKDDVKKHIETKVDDWVRRRSAAIEEVDKEYQKIIELQPVPPPRWVIAAGSRAGLMWGNFVDDFRTAPIPRTGKEGLRAGHGRHATWTRSRRLPRDLDEASEPHQARQGEARAQDAASTYSVKYQYFDEFSRDCEVWLAKNYKAEYHVVDELRGAPTLSNGGLDDKPPPLIIGGQLWHPAETGPATEKVEVDADDEAAAERHRQEAGREEEEVSRDASEDRAMKITGSVLVIGRARRRPCGSAAAAEQGSGTSRPRQAAAERRRRERAVRRRRTRAVQRGARRVQRARQGERLERRDLRERREALRRRGVGADEGEVPGGDVQRGPRVPALRQRQGGEGALPEGALATSRSSTSRAPSSRSTSSRPTATSTRPSPRSSRRSRTRSSRTCRRSSTSRCSRCSATPTHAARTAARTTT